LLNRRETHGNSGWLFRYSAFLMQNVHTMLGDGESEPMQSS
jgi:hypothetical protein